MNQVYVYRVRYQWMNDNTSALSVPMAVREDTIKLGEALRVVN